MSKHFRKTGNCQVCHQRKLMDKLLPAEVINNNILQLIKLDHHNWNPDGYICLSCLNNYRGKYVQKLMEDDLGELDTIEKEVIKSIEKNQLLSENLNEEYEKSLTLGEGIADKVATFGGSWHFIIWALVMLTVWIILNASVWLWKPFDPYPFILLNLGLSMLAALQAPIIMMSQNRQEDRDRMRAENDYQVNLKAEMEIRVLNEKVDQLIHHDIQRLMEVHQIQMEMLSDLHEKA